MIVVDTSALLAIFRGEEEAPRMAAVITNAGPVFLSAANYVEAAMVLGGTRFTLEGEEWLGQFITSDDVTIEPVSVEQAQLA